MKHWVVVGGLLVSSAVGCTPAEPGGNDAGADVLDVAQPIDAADVFDAPQPMDGSDVPQPLDAMDVMDARSDDGNCPGSQQRCGDACMDVQTDPRNCGACGNDCTQLPNAAGGASCSAGRCVFTASNACQPGFAHCGTNPSTGCETDLSDSAHCGTCTTACGEPTPACVPSAGSFQCSNPCAADTPDRCNGGCVSTATDPSNCGSCGHVCVLPNANSACASGACTVASCAPGYVDVDGDATNGCEFEQWSYAYDDGTASAQTFGVAVNSAGNVLIGFNGTQGTSQPARFMSLDARGTIRDVINVTYGALFQGSRLIVANDGTRFLAVGSSSGANGVLVGLDATASLATSMGIVWPANYRVRDIAPLGAGMGYAVAGAFQYAGNGCYLEGWNARFSDSLIVQNWGFLNTFGGARCNSVDTAVGVGAGGTVIFGGEGGAAGSTSGPYVTRRGLATGDGVASEVFRSSNAPVGYGDTASAVLEADGHVYLAGAFVAAANEFIPGLAVFNPDLSLSYALGFDVTRGDSASGFARILRTSDGGLLLVGSVGPASGANGYLVRLAPGSGSQLALRWQLLLGPAFGTSSSLADAVAIPGGFLIAGTQGRKVWLLRVPDTTDAPDFGSAAGLPGLASDTPQGTAAVTPDTTHGIGGDSAWDPTMATTTITAGWTRSIAATR